jgi:calcineurin-like phosphoesterase
LLEKEQRFVRPLNYPPGTPGQGSALIQKPGLPPLAVINLQGRTFMQPLENPFHAIEAEVSRLRQSTRLIFIDFHAEATSGKGGSRSHARWKDKRSGRDSHSCPNGG